MTTDQWEGSQEQAEFTKREHNAVLDVLIAAGMWTGSPPYQGVNAAGQVQMLVDELQKQRADNAELRPIVAAYRDQAHAATGVLEAEKRRADVAEQERDQARAKLVADWHESPELPPGPGLYIAFWVEDGAWAAEYWPDGIEDVDGNKGNWLSLVDDSLRPAPVAWRHLPAVPAKFVQTMRAYAAQDGWEKIVSGSRGN